MRETQSKDHQMGNLPEANHHPNGSTSLTAVFRSSSDSASIPSRRQLKAFSSRSSTSLSIGSSVRRLRPTKSHACDRYLRGALAKNSMNNGGEPSSGSSPIQ